MIRYTQITRRFQFEAAHFLPSHKGKCYRLHGHTYTLEVTIEGRVDSEGMVMDFGDLKEIIKTTILDQYDHQCLNEVYPFTDPKLPPTAENMAMVFFESIAAKRLSPKHIRLYETPDCWVDYEGRF